MLSFSEYNRCGMNQIPMGHQLVPKFKYLGILSSHTTQSLSQGIDPDFTDGVNPGKWAALDEYPEIPAFRPDVANGKTAGVIRSLARVGWRIGNDLIGLEEGFEHFFGIGTGYNIAPVVKRQIDLLREKAGKRLCITVLDGRGYALLPESQRSKKYKRENRNRSNHIS